MRLEHLRVENFRNLAEAELVPSPVLTVICGPNGQGKTNLLEAVWLRCWRRRSMPAAGTRPCG